MRVRLTGSRRLLVLVFCVAAVLLAFALHQQYRPRRISRQHSQGDPVRFAQLVARVGSRFPGNIHVTRREAERDLDEFEWLVRNRYSYAKLRGVDYASALDTIRSGLRDGISRGELAVQLTKLIALFGDGHSFVRDPSVKHMCDRFLPFLVRESANGLAAFKPDRSGFLDSGRPFLQEINGLPLEEWLRAGEGIVPRGSPQFIRFQTIRTLRLTGYLRRELELPASDTIRVKLTSADRQSAVVMTLQAAADRPEHGVWPRTESGILQGNIGYLRIPGFLSADTRFLEDLMASMERFRITDGLIIDMRGVAGGSRAPLRLLLPFFMAADDPAEVLNVAAYRLGHRDDILRARWLFPADWEGWSAAERATIADVAGAFAPEWHPPPDEFSEWHYFVIGPPHEEGYYHYRNPVVVLMDTRCYSASDIFLGAFKGRRGVTLMGTPSGGGSGRYQPYRLRHSEIGVHLSSMASFRPNGLLYDGRGIQPDVLVGPVCTDFIGRTDSVLDAAVSLLTEDKMARPHSAVHRD